MTTPKLASEPGAEAAGTASAQALWLELLQQVASRSAHEIKGALNGVALNLEVVRGRAGDEQLAGKRIAPFAESASAQLEGLITMTEALLALSRKGSELGSVARELRLLGALLAPAAGVAGAPLQLEIPATGSGETAVGGLAVRTVLASALLAATGRGTGSKATLGGADALDLTLSCDDGVAPMLDPRIATIANAEGIEVRGDGSTLTLSFPPRREEPTRETV